MLISNGNHKPKNLYRREVIKIKKTRIKNVVTDFAKVVARIIGEDKVAAKLTVNGEVLLDEKI